MGPQDNPIAPTLPAKQVLIAPVNPEWDSGPTHPFWKKPALATCSP